MKYAVIVEIRDVEGDAVKIYNKTLYITKTDFEHIIDMFWIEFVEELKNEIFLHGLEGKEFDKIQIDCIDEGDEIE